jgi:hypothetical protein
MSVHQFLDHLQDVSQESPLLEALRRVRMASLEQVMMSEGGTDNEWPIWNQPEPPPAQAAQRAAPFDRRLQRAAQTA